MNLAKISWLSSLIIVAGLIALLWSGVLVLDPYHHPSMAISILIYTLGTILVLIGAGMS